MVRSAGEMTFDFGTMFICLYNEFHDGPKLRRFLYEIYFGECADKEVVGFAKNPNEHHFYA